MEVSQSAIKPTSSKFNKGAEMKCLNVLLPLSVLLIAALACNLPWEPTPETPPVVTEEITETVPVTEEPPTEESPTEEPATVEPPYTCAPDMLPATALTVEFCYPATLATGYTQSLIPENPPTLDSAPWEFNPDTIEIILTGYPVDNRYHEPQVLIYPVDDYIALGPNILTTVTELQALLAAQPPNPDFIPFLPVYNAAQMMQAKVSYIDFRSGSGVRFITQYSQAAAPITNDSAIYSFMGLTDDGQYFISATFPVTHPLFYADVLTEPPEGWMTFAENFETYLNNMESDLAMQPLDSFTPNLLPLDEMMSSFLVPLDAIP